jgi:hypothetical protein
MRNVWMLYQLYCLCISCVHTIKDDELEKAMKGRNCEIFQDGLS